MQEREMRDRVEAFLKARLRSMVVPATLGLGLALGGCNSDGLNTDDGGDPATMNDAAGNMDSGVAVRYMAQMPDAGPDLGMVALYMAPLYMAQSSR